LSKWFHSVAATLTLLGLVFAWRGVEGAATEEMVLLPAGSYTPLYNREVRDPVTGNLVQRATPQPVAAFWLDVVPVTNGEYLQFVRQHPEWRRSAVKRTFADENYLQHWAGDLELGPLAPSESPVVFVSWFAARAFLATQGKRLPTVDEWEYAGAASETVTDATKDTTFQGRIRTWYARPTPAVLPEIRSTFRNVYGVWDLHGLVWEWTRDFNSALVTGESRGDATLDRGLYCGAAASGAADFENYAAFMRFAYRSSLQARYCTGNLGFRGASDRGDQP
jgi:sulfatase modifying factor 1